MRGSEWNVDWRGQTVPIPDFIGGWRGVADLNLPNPTDWEPHQGQSYDRYPVRTGYDPIQLQVYDDADCHFGSWMAFPSVGIAPPENDVAFMELAQSAGFDVGLQHATQLPGPRMIFRPPPTWGE